jgi:CHAT domain-containing protein/Flp pilus assembly protein TadD
MIIVAAIGDTVATEVSDASLAQKKDKQEKKPKPDKRDNKSKPPTEPAKPSDPAASNISLGKLAYSTGYYSQAEPLFKSVLEYRERTVGRDHPDVAEALNYLGLVYSAMGHFTKSEQCHSRALQIREKALGPAHQDVAVSLNNLAALYDDMGDYVKAEAMYERALAIWEKKLGPSDTYVAKALNSLAVVYHRRGDYQKAESHYLRALAIQEKVHGPEDTEVAVILSNLGVFYDDQGDYAKAETLHLRALAIYEKRRGPNHPDTGSVLNNLAWLYRAKGDYSRSESLYLRSIEIKQKRLGPEHPEVADSINPLAALYDARGAYQMAEPLYLRALSIREKALGPDHPDVVKSLNNLALLYEATGDTAKAIQYRARCNDARERNIELNLTSGSERQKLLYLATVAGETNATVSLHVKSAPNDEMARRLALTAILRRKGRALDAMADSIATLRRRLNADDRALLDQYTGARSQLATLTLGGRAKKPAEYQAEIKGLEDKVERLETDISRRSAEFRAQSQPVTLEAIQAAIPAGGALVEFFSYRPVNLKYETIDARFGQPRYVVYVIPNRGQPGWADLGEAKSIDSAIDALRAALRDPARTDVRTLARALDQTVMQPVRKLLGLTRDVLLSPDGSLNLIPFGALVDEQNRYLVRQYSFTYLSTGRDLLRLSTRTESNNGPIIVADPDFGGESGTSAARGLKIKTGISGASTGAVELSQIVFSPLPGTAAEAQALRSIVRDATVLTRGQATEEAIKQVSGPKILHIATHGFFLQDAADSMSAGRALMVKPAQDTLGVPWMRARNPLLRAGLGLAGANLQSSNGDDGVLTALEAAGLDLWGTKLVVLSACDTGVGEVKNGEGVYGLRRALVLAGSETQVMSLWPVSDDATRGLMVEYYKGLLMGRGRGEALRKVQLEMLLTKDRQHPFYWASFIQSGDWANLSGKR